MTKLKYSTIKKLVSKEELLKRIRLIEDDPWIVGFLVNPEEFLNTDIYDEYIKMKCLDCDYEKTFEYDLLAELMYMNNMDYPKDHCYGCSGGTTLLKDIHSKLKKNKKK